MYLEMHPVMQLYNTFRNRWCGAYFASKGIRVIPTVSWGNENTFDFCFEGIPKGSTVAVSTYMARAHGSHADQKDFFMKGYREMLRRIEPARVICYSEPFPEMEGNIVYVDYELSSWKFGDEDEYTPSKYLTYIMGDLPAPEFNGAGFVVKTGYIMGDEELFKGMGSAYGGKWRPKKEDDERLIGKSGEIKITYDNNGYKRLTKIGEDGRAVWERHMTDTPNPKYHSNPHDHKIEWIGPDEHPHFRRPINYFDGNIPEFKYYTLYMKTGANKMDYIISDSDDFKTISEFKDAMRYHDEIVFAWKGKEYGIFWDGKLYCIAEIDGSNEKWCETSDDILEYIVGDSRLRDVITKVKVTLRNL